MSLTSLSFRYRAVTVLLATLLVAMGVFALGAMSRREDPDLKARFARIVTVYPGASAEQVERLVAEPLERTLREVDDVKEVTTTSRPGVVIADVSAADRMTGSLDKLMDDLRERTADLQGSLPAGVGAIQVNDRFADTAAVILAVSRPGASPHELETSAKKLRDALKALPEVGEVVLQGVEPETVTVSLSSARLAAYGGAVTPDAIAGAIGARNIPALAGGSAPSGAARLSLRPTGELASERELDGLIVATVDGAPVYLRDVATVTRGYADPPGERFRANGQPAVAVVVSMRRGKNIAALGERVTKVAEAVRQTLPPGTTLTAVNDLPRSVARRVSGFFTELGLAVGIIAVVMLLFMGVRSALLVGAMLPLTMLGTFAAMWIAGRDIQQMSIAALIIALALVVDNAVVILDNIEEKLGEFPGDRKRAAIVGADEIRGPLLTANLVAISSFLPLAFLPGGVGDFVRDLGLVTALSLIVSVLLNLTVLPLLCAAFLRPVSEEKKSVVQRWLDRSVDRLRDGKASLAQLAYRRPAVPVVLAALALLGALSLIPKLGLQFFPLAERDQFVVDVWLPEGRDLSATEQVVKKVEARLVGREGVSSVAAYIGRGGPRFYYNVSPEAPAANYAQLVVNTRTLADADRLLPLVQGEVQATIPEARVKVKKLEQGPPVGAPVAIQLSGPSIEVLRERGQRIREILAATPGAISLSDSFGERPLQARLALDPDRLALSGLTNAQVASATRLGLSGQTVASLREGDTEIPIDLRLDAAERTGADSVLNLYLPGGVQVRELGSLALEARDARIVRRDGVRTLTVSAYAEEGTLPSAVLAAAKPRLEALTLPPGYALRYAGESEATGDSFRDMSVVFSVAIVFNIVALTVQFGSAPVVLATLSAVPLGVIGAVPGLYLARQSFGFMAFLGIAALGGIVTNHTIFLFHYAQEEARREGVPMTVALVDASRRRLRPILLTVLLSVGALLPQAYSGSKLWPPLDWAIIAGLLVSTFLTMIVVPSVYALLDRKAAHAALVPAVGLSLLLMASPARAEEPLTLDAAVAGARERSPALQAARARLTGAGGKIDEARGARRWTFGASAQAVQLSKGQVVSFGPVTVRGAYPTQTNFGASATLPFDVAGLLRANVDVATLQRALAEAEVARVERETTLNIRLAYLDALRARSLERVATLAEENAVRRLADAEKVEKAGLAPRFDVIRAQTALADARQRRLSAGNAVRLADAALNAAIRRPVETPVTLAGQPELREPEGSLETWRKGEGRPELLQTELGVRLAEKGVFLARRSSSPEVGLQLAGQLNPNAGAFQLRDVASVALSIRVPLGDGGVATARKRQADGEREAAQAEIVRVRDAIALQVEAATIGLADARARLKVAEAALTQAREASRMASVRYRAGLTPENAVSPLLEVAEAQTAEAQAESNVENARWDIEVALARLLFATGNS